MAAIYQWFPGGKLVATSTLYPAETDNGLTFGASLVSGYMQEHAFDELAPGLSFVSALLEEVVIYGPIYEDELEPGLSFVGATLVEVVIFGPTPEDALAPGLSFISADLVDRLVEADTQDTGLEFSATIVSGSMTDA